MDSGADIHIVDKDNHTPLYHAIVDGYPVMVETLVSKYQEFDCEHYGEAVSSETYHTMECWRAEKQHIIFKKCYENSFMLYIIEFEYYMRQTLGIQIIPQPLDNNLRNFVRMTSFNTSLFGT